MDKEEMNHLITAINALEKGDFIGWTTDSKNGYLTATMTIKELLNKYHSNALLEDKGIKEALPTDEEILTEANSFDNKDVRQGFIEGKTHLRNQIDFLLNKQTVKEPNGKKCTYCTGTGKSQGFSNIINCFRCNGTGIINPNIKEKQPEDHKEESC